MIPQQNLSRLSNRLAKAGGRRVPETVLERDYCLAWFLVGMSKVPLYQRLAFKGGTALKRCYFGDYRFSEDLDFTLLTDTPFETIRKELDLVFKKVRIASGIGFNFGRVDRNSHENSYTFYLNYEGPLPLTVNSKEVKVDVTIRERLIFPIMEHPVLKGYDEYADLPKNAIIYVYSLDEIFVEKIVAVLDPARNEPRDLYDLWHLITGKHVKMETLIYALEQKLEFRKRKIACVSKNFLLKENRYKKLWTIRLEKQMIDLPEFDSVYRAVKRAFRQTGLIK